MIQNVPPPYPGGEVEYHGTIIERIIADNNYIHVVLYESVYLTNFEEWFYLMHKRRPIDNTNWETEKIVTTAVMEPSRLIKPVFSSDQRLNIICYIYPDNWFDPALAHYYLNNNIWYGPFQISNQTLDIITNFCLSANSNDLYAYWIYWDSNILYRSQYDAVPLAPQNLELTIYRQGTNRYPKLDWSLNNEPDVRRTDNTNAYKIWRRTRNAGLGIWSNWGVIAQKNQDVSTYTDLTINTAGGGDKEAEYRLSIKDINDNWSDYSSTVSTVYGMGLGEKRGFVNTENTLVKFGLDQNFPNPFNPSTQINYSLQKDGIVSLRVYDMLGTEVAVLVNEHMKAGNHSVEFNASSLPSGIYIYKLASGNFTVSKKLILLK